MGLGDKKTWVSWLGWTVLLFGLGCFLYMERQKQIPIKAKSAFAKAVVEEKNLFIDRILSDYDVHRSKDTIPGNEKREWADQSFLTLEDVNRHRLDSLFRLELRREEVPVLWCAVSCLVDGKIHAVRKDLLQEDFLLVKQVYRIDNEEEKYRFYRKYSNSCRSTMFLIFMCMAMCAVAAYLQWVFRGYLWGFALCGVVFLIAFIVFCMYGRMLRNSKKTARMLQAKLRTKERRAAFYAQHSFETDETEEELDTDWNTLEQTSQTQKLRRRSK